MKKEYLKKLSSRVNQKLLILLSRPDFQKDIKELRIKWNIPEIGIQTDGENQVWHDSFEAESDRYINEEWLKCKNEMVVLQEKREFPKAEQKQDEFNASVPINAFGNDLKDIAKNYKLSPRWQHGIKRYLLFNDPKNMELPLGVQIVKSLNLKKGEEQLSIIIEADTTLEDIKASWAEIEFHRNRLSYRIQNKFQPIDEKNLERGKLAYELRQQKKKLGEIADIFLQKYGKAFGETEISSIIRRYKKQLGIN